MSASLAEVLARSRGSVPACLAPAAAWHAWQALPEPFVPGLGQVAWECRLGGPLQVDLQAGLGESPASRALLAALEPDQGPAEQQGARVFARQWAAGRFGRTFPRLFMEVDQPAPGQAARPLLFPAVHGPDRGAWLAAAWAAVGLLSAGRAEPALRQGLARLVAALPPEADPCYVCWLGPRDQSALRWIGSVPWRALPELLERVGWPGDPLQVEQAAGALLGGSSHAPIGLDVVPDGIGPTLGVELFWARQAGADPRMLRALADLSTWPELDAARVAAAARWARGEGVRPELDPDLQVKLVFRHGQRSAKAYLGCWTRP